MGDVKQLIQELHQAFGDMGHEKEWEKLRDCILAPGKTPETIKRLDKDVKAFFKSSAPEEDKTELMGYTESLAILMDAVNKGLLK